MSPGNHNDVTRGHFEALVRIVCEVLGNDHAVAKTLRVLLAEGTEDAIRKGIAQIRGLPIATRDEIFHRTKRLLHDEAKLLEWLMEKTGAPTTIPGNRTIQ